MINYILIILFSTTFNLQQDFILSLFTLNTSQQTIFTNNIECGDYLYNDEDICLIALQSCLNEVEDMDTIIPGHWGGDWVKNAYVAGCGNGYIHCINRNSEDIPLSERLYHE